MRVPFSTLVRSISAVLLLFAAFLWGLYTGERRTPVSANEDAQNGALASSSTICEPDADANAGKKKDIFFVSCGGFF